MSSLSSGTLFAWALRGLRSLFLRAGSLFNRIGRRLSQSPKEKTSAAWREVQGDRTLRLSYDLGENSVVFDLGGYEGHWASDVFSMYCCIVHVFEPVIEFADGIARRFSRNKRIFVHPFGLSDENRTLQISADGDSSSFCRSGNDLRGARLVRAMDFIRQEHIERIDLMKINIEGGEYDLLEHLLDSGFVRNIGNIQIQFHDFVPNAEKRMASIQSELKRTHRLTYQYLFVWENWTLR